MLNRENQNAKKQLKKINSIIDRYADKESLREYIKKEFIDEKGQAVIEINIYNELELYDKLSFEKQLELNPDIYKYIDQKAKIIPAHIPIKLRFHGKKIDKEEQEKIKKLIDEHYSIELFSQQKNIRIMRKKTMRLAIIGAIIFLICFYLSSIDKYTFFTDILSIIGTFSIWEVASLLMLGKKDIDMQTVHIAKMLIHEIEFI